MATLEAAIYTMIGSDATLITLATGGIWDQASIVAAGKGREGLTLDVITAGTPIVQPSVFVNWSSSSPIGPVKLRAERIFFEVYFYDHQNYEVIRQMRARAYAILHEKRVAVDSPGWVRTILHAGDLKNMRDERLAGAMMERTRYQVIKVEV